MKATELRIGNLIYAMKLNPDNGKYEFPVTPVDYHILFNLINKNTNAIEPIHLTEEWLVRFGFKPMQCITFDWKTEWFMDVENLGWSIGVLIEDYPIDNPNCGCISLLNREDRQVSAVPPDLYDKEEWTEEDEVRAANYTETYEKWRQPVIYYLKYVHQLQNCFFSLTGQELTIN